MLLRCRAARALLLLALVTAAHASVHAAAVVPALGSAGVPALGPMHAPALAAAHGAHEPAHGSHEPTHAAHDDERRIVTDRPDPLDLPLPEEDDAFLFAVFGDRTGGPAEGVAVLAQAVRDVNLVEPDLVMTVGDLVQGYNDTPQWLDEMREFRGIMDGLACPWFPVAGNHDVYWRGGEGAVKPAGEHEASYERWFGPLWYAFEHKDAWFIALYSDEGDPATGRKDFNRPECQRMSPEQKAWLAATLEAARGARHVFVFLHHPRWLGRNYGDDWEEVHALLAAAGNVSAVFAGHIHHMRYDGERDGIEYFTLATVGGGQAGDLPEAGWLHQVHLVTVREDRIAVAAYPVGAAIDPRAITGELAEEARALAGALRPEVLAQPALGADLGVDGELAVRLRNPVNRPIEVALALGGPDRRWTLVPDHAHRVLLPAEVTELVFRVVRPAAPLDENFAPPRLELAADYLAERLRVPMPRRALDVPLDLAALPLPLPATGEAERALVLDGEDDHVRIESEALALPDGPFTIEGRLRASAFRARQGFLCKTEGSELGLFVSEGEPAFYVHLAGRYTSLGARRPLLEVGRWHHVAGVFDGREARLYVDGALVARAAAAGERTRNALPLLVGADVDGRGHAVSCFPGEIDEVRVSKVARYAGERVEPALRFEPDADTVLLLHMDGEVGPWVPDASPERAHGRLAGRD